MMASKVSSKKSPAGSKTKILERGVTYPRGFLASGISCGMKRYNRRDLAVIFSEKGATASAVYTTNKVVAAPLIVTKDKLKNGRLQAVVVNSRCANALTGKRGIRDAVRMSKVCAKELGIAQSLVVPESTGVIGRYMPMDKIIPGIKKACERLSDTEEASYEAAEAILTTDTFVKEAAIDVTLKDGTNVRIGGMTKGSGMITPKMKLHATTLTFITTDAAISRGKLDEYLQDCTDDTFNQIHVDNVQSTNDICLVMANGYAGNRIIKNDENFKDGLKAVMLALAKLIVRDGEGATKFIEVEVTGARTEQEARAGSKGVVASELVRTAIFGEDPNFGRIMAAIGDTECDMVLEKTNVRLSGRGQSALIVDRGVPKAVPGTKVFRVAKSIFQGKSIKIAISLGLGKSKATAYGCDMSYGYVEINSRYTT